MTAVSDAGEDPSHGAPGLAPRKSLEKLGEEFPPDVGVAVTVVVVALGRSIVVVRGSEWPLVADHPSGVVPAPSDKLLLYPALPLDGAGACVFATPCEAGVGERDGQDGGDVPRPRA